MKFTNKTYGLRPARIHIDRLDQKDGAVWGVTLPAHQGLRAAYTRAHVIEWRGASITQHRPGTRQPKAWVGTFGRVRRVVDTSQASGPTVIVVIS